MSNQMNDVKELIACMPAATGANAFAEKGDPCGPGNCHWCGAKLRLAKMANHPTIDGHRDARGDYGDNSFCGLRCGYMFGVQMAVNGRRLQVVFQVYKPTDGGSV